MPSTLPRRLPLTQPSMQHWSAALVLLAAALPVQAQTPPDAGRLLDQTRPPALPALPPATAPRVVDAPVRPTLTLPEGVSVQASGFRVSGARSYPPELLVEMLKPWLGRRLDLNGLNEAAGALTRHYQRNGHLLSYAYVPAQRVEGGIVEIAVLEGQLEAVQIVTAQDVRLRDEVIQAHTDRLATRPEAPQPVLLADVERQMLLLNDIAGVTARAAFTPGARTGGADMVVSVAEDEPLSLRVTADNHGAKSTGEVRVGLGLQLRNVSGWGDQTDARAMVSRQGGLVSGSLSTLVPVGGDGLRLGASLSRLSYELAGSFRELGATGHANTFGVELNYPLVRSTDTNLGLRLAGEMKQLRDEVQLVGRSVPKRNSTLEATLSADHRDSFGGVSAGRISASLGSLRLLDDAQRATDAAGLQTARSYGKLGFQAVRQQTLSGPFSVVLRVAGQASGGNLDSSEKFSLAGPGAVRAYAPGEASVDQGALVSVEARYAQAYLGGSVTWALFHDRAEGRINRQPTAQLLVGNEPRLSGTGLSVQWSGADLGLSASIAWRGTRVPTAEGGDPKPRVYLQVVLSP
ncbi:ShlB/FhaC/HecB family hemolysin secretion/activation protein [Rubrivivax rivuli]|uniref:ShlB/FhaC/HecB family hemolysin secretion/activation protein n=1 Tax=Rubrivivax rivuli TaxID=1862385 RepID=A0A437RHT6_9BURK|nr:ShlB/FhaC/HecB family hemolysin secretion/activation protein [Rubrivivax rivuli]RVU46238.1 ShlB/FhaC/HecB family hemolysin secretion/activation protein [Rubrivivax rivuli]